jgi:endonuclease-3 related protein
MPSILDIYDALLNYWGPQNWWPGETTDEICIGAILTQNTNWSNVEKALMNLKRKGLLSISSIASAPKEIIEECLKPAGTYRRKALYLMDFSKQVISQLGCIEKLFTLGPNKARKWLLKQKGIGPETADSILCYGGNFPLLVIDAYTLRLGKRMGWLSPEINSYDKAQEELQLYLPKDPKVLGEFHALIVKHSKEICRKKPRCSMCFMMPCCSAVKDAQI